MSQQPPEVGQWIMGHGSISTHASPRAGSAGFWLLGEKSQINSLSSTPKYMTHRQATAQRTQNEKKKQQQRSARSTATISGTNPFLVQSS